MSSSKSQTTENTHVDPPETSLNLKTLSSNHHYNTHNYVSNPQQPPLNVPNQKSNLLYPKFNPPSSVRNRHIYPSQTDLNSTKSIRPVLQPNTIDLAPLPPLPHGNSVIPEEDATQCSLCSHCSCSGYT